MARVLKPVPGYSPVRDKARHYINDSTGERITKRDYQELQAAREFGEKLTNEQAAAKRKEKVSDLKQHNIKTPALFKKVHKQTITNRLVSDYKYHTAAIRNDIINEWKTIFDNATESEKRKLAEIFEDETGFPFKAKGYKDDDIKVRGNSADAKEFKRIKSLLDASGKKRKKEGKEYKSIQDKGLIEALIKLGRRTAEADHPPGTSPGVEGL